MSQSQSLLTEQQIMTTSKVSSSYLGITKPAICCLARRRGVKHISALIYEETHGVLKTFLENIIRDSVTYTEHAKHKTVTALDMSTISRASFFIPILYIAYWTVSYTPVLDQPLSTYFQAISTWEIIFQALNYLVLTDPYAEF
ncbi:hypothetical protein GYMLUDRAFT_252752 [Collybiopsis luxurians FD-317 M1]|uniref:Histone H4 n=1 Tax=Collybiopsis luxurians FD-317 M1 TaxID=944289 RepID=A0A0D0B913_9AGAR|nr:hypothetical protein GYMLUDRAFT_252752 [Collybiopsis luxurians FD-317 M1]